MPFRELDGYHFESSTRVVNEAENDYSEWFYGELHDEIQPHLPIWAEAMTALTRLGRGHLSVNELTQELQSDAAVTQWLAAEGKAASHIIDTLFNFGVLGNLSKDGVWLFKYKDPTLKWNPNNNIIIHFGFHKKLRLRPY